MIDIEISTHTKEMLIERNIPEEWMWRAINAPDQVDPGADNNTHYIKSIAEHGGRFLRVVVNPHVYPNRVVTVFFDRRLRRKQ